MLSETFLGFQIYLVIHAYHQGAFRHDISLAVPRTLNTEPFLGSVLQILRKNWP